LTMLNRQPTGRDGGLHVIVDPTDGFLLVPHNPGTIAVLPIRPDGSLAPMSDAADWSGTLGPHRTEQTTPHPHHVQFDRRGRFLIVPDKGLDLVHVFTLDTATGKLVANKPQSVAARSGSAPRHVALHPAGRHAYVVNELDSTVTTYRFDEDRGTLEPIQVIPTIPTTFTGNNTGAEITVTRSGRFVYASNRGHNSIAIFAVEESGVLSHARWESTLGRTPRFIGFDPSESFLYAANQGSNTIVAFRVDQSSGALSPTGYVVEVGAPTCIVFSSPGSV
jgi:6-phosphogluconolactonase